MTNWDRMGLLAMVVMFFLMGVQINAIRTELKSFSCVHGEIPTERTEG